MKVGGRRAREVKGGMHGRVIAGGDGVHAAAPRGVNIVTKRSFVAQKRD